MSKTNSTGDVDRVRILESLISGDESLAELKSLLRRFEFDSEPLVTLSADHISDVLMRFMNNEISADYVEQWADLIEVRDDIRFDLLNERQIKQAIHELANPVLSGPLDEEMARKLLSSLQQAEDGER